MRRFLTRLVAGLPRPAAGWDSAQATVGVVHAALKPRGLVRADGVVVAAWWVGAGPPPEPGTAVHRRWSADGRWLVESMTDKRPT